MSDALNSYFLMRKATNVPVVTYHSIADARDAWQFRHLSCPVSHFESHLKALNWANYVTISLQTLYGYVAGRNRIPLRSVVLTFDDGYLDNWIYVYPLLKKYRCHATIFINPDFVAPCPYPRPTLEDVWKGRICLNDLPTSGFLSWQEMREMENSGYIDIQCHGLTHTWYFCSEEIIDFHHPGDAYPWLSWNACPDRKHMWMTEDQHSFVPWGTPIYQHEKSLATLRYFPDENLNAILSNFVCSHGNEDFFRTLEWYRKLEQIVADYRQNHTSNDRFESDAEYKSRLYQELGKSKKILEERLAKTIEFLCWPGGGYNSTSIEISKDVGYLATVHSSHDRSIKENRFGHDPSHISRVSAPAFHWDDSTVEYKGGLHLISLLNSVRGSHLYSTLYKALKIPFKISQYLNRQCEKIHNRAS